MATASKPPPPEPPPKDAVLGSQRASARLKGPTARDVAKLAGVSQSTVSRVLNRTGTHFISQETSRRVREAAAQLGYSPHPLARALRGKRTQLLGLIVREIEDPFFAKLVAILSAQARDLGYQIVLGHAQSDPSQALQMTAVLDARRCDGVLLLGDLRDDEAAIQEMLRDNRAVVSLCRGRSPGSMPTVNSDNRSGVRLLVDHLTRLGHRRMAFIDGGWLGDIRERREAFVEEAGAHNLELLPEAVQTDANDLEGGFRAMARLLQLPRRPTAVLAADDVMAIGALKAAAEAGLRLPQDLSLTGFDDIPMAKFACPSLTTVRQPVQAMARQALEWLLALIGGDTIPHAENIDAIQPELVVRQSTGAAPAPG